MESTFQIPGELVIIVLMYLGISFKVIWDNKSSVRITIKRALKGE